MTKFIGREPELRMLRRLFKKKSASLVVIRGRRRIGKSRLIQELGRWAPCHVFSGLPPQPGVTRQDQIDSLLGQMATLFAMPRLAATSWQEALWLLSRECQTGKMIIALDEISWLASQDGTFLGELKNAWDLQFSRNPHLILILCGSVSSWIEENILKHTGFVGRVSLDLHLKELPLYDAVKFWASRQNRIAPYEIFKVLSVTGGVPRYLEEIHPEQSAEDNIRELCFQPQGLLFREYEQIFSDLFDHKGPFYTKILQSLAEGPQAFDELHESLGITSGGYLTEHLRTLSAAGFITEHPTWHLGSQRTSRFSQYHLRDNYIRFYLRCIAPHRQAISIGVYKEGNVLGWSAIMGLQFENLVLNNLLSLLDALGIPHRDVLQIGPYFQRPTTRRQGCQIDLLIQTRYRAIYICENKFSQEKIGIGIVKEMQRKQTRVLIPKGWSIHTVLIHVNGITDELEWSEAIDHCVDFSRLLSQPASTGLEP